MSVGDGEVVALRSLVGKLEAALASGQHNLNSKLRARSLAQITRKLKAEGSAVVGTPLWNEASELVQVLDALGYFKEDAIVSSIRPQPKALPEPGHQSNGNQSHAKAPLQNVPTASLPREHKKAKQPSPRPKQRRKPRKKGKPHLIFCGAFESSRRRH